MKKIVGGLMVWLIMMTSFNAMSQSQDLPMLIREDTLRNYSLNQVTFGLRQVTANSMVSSEPSGNIVRMEGRNAEEVIQKLLDATITYRLVNPSDFVTGYIWLYDTRGRLLFFGYARYTLAEIGGKDGGPSYTFSQQEVPLLEGVSSAEIIPLDANAQTPVEANGKIKLKVTGGSVYFPPVYAGAPNGLMVVTMKSGEILTYKLGSPMVVNVKKYSEGSGETWKIAGHHVFQSTKGTLGIEIIESRFLPTALVSVGVGQLILVDVKGLVEVDGKAYFERPTSVIFRQVDGPSSGVLYFGPVDGPVYTKLPTNGEYRLEFDGWVRFGKPNTLYVSPKG